MRRGFGCGFLTRTLNHARPPQAEAAKKAEAARQAAVEKAHKETDAIVSMLGVVTVPVFTCFEEAFDSRGIVTSSCSFVRW